MNATTNSPSDLLQGDEIGSDTDTNPDHVPEFYQPISAADSDDNSDEEHHHGYVHSASDFGDNRENGCYEVENGISAVDLNGDAEEQKSGDEEEDEEERMRAASDSAIVRAFREDERRRNAPLSTENAMRVMEAMRGVSFGGLAPDWAGRVPEDQWVDQLRRLRQPTA